MSTKPFATGHCLCGAVSYTINGEPVLMGHCHCKDCQRASGAGHMSNAFFQRDDFVLNGQTGSHSVTADSGNINTRHFCRSCGSRVYGEVSARPGVVVVPVGGIDDNSWFNPQRVVYTKSRQSWDPTTSDCPNFEMMPPPAKP
jgi:hypothetical protein